MYNLRNKMITIVTIICCVLTIGSIAVQETCFAATETNSNTTFNSTTKDNNQNNTLEQESTATTLLSMKEEQLKTIEDYKAKYGSDTYGYAAYILHMIQVYSIPLGLVGIAVCAIFEYVLGVKRLDIRDKGFNTMIAVVTIIVICQVLPLIFAIVVKSRD